MALKKFRAPSLPNPPHEYDVTYVRQLVRTIELYFSQLDSQTPNQAQSYTAEYFYGGAVTPGGYTTDARNALTVDAGAVVFDTTLKKLCFFTGVDWEIVLSTPDVATALSGVSASLAVGTITHV